MAVKVSFVRQNLGQVLDTLYLVVTPFSPWSTPDIPLLACLVPDQSQSASAPLPQTDN